MYKTNVFIDARPILSEKMSGIGHVTLKTLEALNKNQRFLQFYNPILLGYKNKRYIFDTYNLTNFEYKSLPMPQKGLRVLERLNIDFIVELIYGKGIYLFPNFQNWKLFRSKSITYFHDIAFLLYPETVEPLNLIHLQKNYLKWAKRTDVLVTVSESSKVEILNEKSISSLVEKIEVLINGVDTELTPTNKQATEEVARKYNIEAKFKSFILYVGNIEPRKNIAQLIHAYRSLSIGIKKEFPLVIVGGGGWKSDEVLGLISESIDAGDMIYHPDSYVNDEDLYTLIAGAKVVVQPSLHEGFGVTPLLAASIGITNVVSDIPSLREVTHFTQSSTFYFDPYSEKSLKNKLEESLEYAPKDMVLLRNEIQQARDHFDWNLTASKLVSIMEELAI